MRKTICEQVRGVSRIVLLGAAACLFASVAAAQAPPPVPILANENRVPAGKLENGVLTLSLEIRAGVWHAESEDGSPLYVQAFGETGKPAQIPGPLIRVPANTNVHVTITNTLKVPATVFGFLTHPASSDPGIVVGPNQSRDVTFSAGAPGTYFYWARTIPKTNNPFGFNRPVRDDSQLNGAFIVDAPGAVPPDRVLVLGIVRVPPDILHPGFDVASINGKDYPYTEPLQYAVGDTIRWRVINPSVIDHPMHLHGAFYKILSEGNGDQETRYAPDEQQSVVTNDMKPGSTMMLEWTPSHPGRWLFHCHFLVHIAPTVVRVPVYSRRFDGFDSHPEPMTMAADPQHTMSDMAGMIMMINVKAKPGAPPEKVARHPRKMELVIEPDATDGKRKLISCSIREGDRVVSSHNQSAGPPLVLTRDEPVEITVINHLQEPTTIHWHGIELDSYYDGVMGGGMGDQVTPDIPPGGSFVARFTPDRAGTFIYHTHSPDPTQLADGVYGAIVVLNPGQKYDAEHERLIVIGALDVGLLAKHITVNGSQTFPQMSFQPGVSYRVRVVNIAPDLMADVVLGSKENPVTWREIAKDGADVPARLANPEKAAVHLLSGETYDFEIRADKPGNIPVVIANSINRVKLAGDISVH